MALLRRASTGSGDRIRVSLAGSFMQAQGVNLVKDWPGNEPVPGWFRKIVSLGLQDRVRFLQLRQTAGDDLALAMPHDERLALMGLFWRAGQSDGFVDGNELQILQQSAAQLQLGWDEVEAYLRNIW